MKRTHLLYPAALLSAALMASPAFAADNLCEANLQKIKDTLTTKQATLSESLKDEVTELQTKAEHAHHAKDEKGCVEATTSALQRLDTPGIEGSGKGQGSGS